MLYFKIEFIEGECISFKNVFTLSIWAHDEQLNYLITINGGIDFGYNLWLKLQDILNGSKTVMFFYFIKGFINFMNTGVGCIKAQKH
jgi:hypothetical protein